MVFPYTCTSNLYKQTMLPAHHDKMHIDILENNYVDKKKIKRNNNEMDQLLVVFL